MSSYVSSFSILVAVLVIVTFGVALLIVAALRTYSERRARKRNEELAEQVKKRLADLRNSPPPHQKRVDQGNNDFEDTDHEAGQRAKEATGQYTRQLQGTVGQDADQRRATEAEPWATFHRGSVFDRQGQYNLAVEAYQRVLDAGTRRLLQGRHSTWVYSLRSAKSTIGRLKLTNEPSPRSTRNGHPRQRLT